MSEGKKSWDKNEVVLLISEWQLLPELWDMKSKFYRNRIKKQNTLQGLAEKFGTSVHEITRKLHNLRTQFHAEARKIKTKNIERGADDIQSTWEFFDVLKSICDYTNLSTTETKINEDEHYQKTEADDCIVPQTKRTKREAKSEPDYYQPVNKSACVTDKPIDDFQIFGDYVASELRNLRSTENQRKLKLDIQRAIIRVNEIELIHSSTPQSTDSSI